MGKSPRRLTSSPEPTPLLGRFLFVGSHSWRVSFRLFGESNSCGWRSFPASRKCARTLFHSVQSFGCPSSVRPYFHSTRPTSNSISYHAKRDNRRTSRRANAGKRPLVLFVEVIGVRVSVAAWLTLVVLRRCHRAYPVPPQCRQMMR